MKKIIICIIVCTTLSCNNKTISKKDTKDLLIGRWTFIKKINGKYLNYNEIDFLNKEIRINFEVEPYPGPLNYSIKNDTLNFRNNNFLISQEKNKIVLKHNGNYEYHLYKIPFDEDVPDPISMYYLRRYYFMTHLNQISIESAIDSLKSLDLTGEGIGSDLIEEPAISKGSN